MYVAVYRYMIRSMHRLSVCESMHLSHIPLCMQCVCNPPDEVSFYCSICSTLNSPFPIFTNCENLMDFKLKRHLFAIFATYVFIDSICQLFKILAQRIPKNAFILRVNQWKWYERTKKTSVG